MSVFGRTNEPQYPVWLALASPVVPPADGWLSDLCARAGHAGCPIDVTSSPALWGGGLRGTASPLMVCHPGNLEKAESGNAFDQTQAHLIEVLSAVGRESIDYYFLPVRKAWEESATDGVLRALEFAREEGMVRFVGLRSGSSGLATLGFWQFRDAFEVLSLPDNPAVAESLIPLAQERRVGVLSDASTVVPGTSRRVIVRTPEEIDLALA